MFIRFCVKCGQRVSESDVASGAARLVDEHRALCAKCAPPPPHRSSQRGLAPARKDSQRGLPVAAPGPARKDSGRGLAVAAPGPARKDSGRGLAVATPGPVRSPSAAHAAHPTPTRERDAVSQPGSKIALFVGSAAVALVLALAAVLFFARTEPPEAKKAPPGGKDEARGRKAEEPLRAQAAEPSAVPRPDPAETRPPEKPAPPSPAPPDGYDPRAAVAASLLAQAKAHLQANPAALSTYKEKLEDLTSRYARTPASEEAVRLLSELKLPEPPAAKGADSTPPKEAPKEASTPPEAAAKAEPAASASAAKAEYARLLKGLQALISQKGWDLARVRVEDASKDPNLAAFTEQIARDGELLALAAKASQAVPRGAALLSDGRPFVLVQTDGKRFEVGKGRKIAVLKADKDVIQVEQDVGGGRLGMGVPLGKLTFETCFELARLGLPEDDGESKLALALMRFAALGGKLPASEEKPFLSLLEQAGKQGAAPKKVAQLRGWLESAKREGAADEAWKGVEETITARDRQRAPAAYAAFKKEHADTAAFADARPKFQELEERLRELDLSACTAGLKLWLKLDETEGRKARNSVDQGVDADVEGAKWVKEGRFGGALSLNGEGDYVITAAPMHAAFGDGNVTIAVWINPKAGGVVADELGQRGLEAGWHDSQIELMDDGEVKVRVWKLDGLSVGKVKMNEWHHVVVRYSAKTSTLDGFVNGVKSAGAGTGPKEWNFGGEIYYAFGPRDSTNLGHGGFFKGLMDDIRVYNRALTDEEVRLLAGVPK